MTNREKIIEGIKLLKESCKRIPTENCHTKCPYEDICMAIRAVGKQTNWHTPNMWNMDLLKGK